MSQAIEGLLAIYPEETQAISRALCEMARRVLPGAHEFVYHAAINYAVTPSPLDRVCYIAPQRGHVTLGFFFGTQLPDSRHLLEGEGIRMRHVKVRSAAQATDPELERLLIAAWAAGPASVAQLRAARKRT